MRRRAAFLLAAAVAAAGASIATARQSQPAAPAAPSLHYVFIEHVKPSMIAEYEAATKSLVEAFAAHEIEGIQFSAASGAELGYVYAMPLESFGSMESLHASWEAAVEKIGMEKWREVAARGDAAVDHREAFFVRRRTDLSFVPDAPSVMPEEIGYVAYGFYYVIPGHEAQLEAMCRSFAELYGKLGMNDGWTVYQALTGADLPLYVIAHPAKSATDFHEHAERMQTAMGEEGMKLVMESYAHVRRFERREGRPRPDLGYLP
jgi:hypothetical protein